VNFTFILPWRVGALSVDGRVVECDLCRFKMKEITSCSSVSVLFLTPSRERKLKIDGKEADPI